MTYIIAHRGFCKANKPENSIISFQAAKEANADGIEFDIQLTSDGHLVCFHDTALTKLGRSEQINELKLRELTEIELTEGVTIPSLEEVLEKFSNDLLLNIELKSQKKGVSELVQVIHQYNIDNTPNKIIISSYHGEALHEIKKLDPDIPTGLLVHFAKNKLPLIQKYRCDALHPYYDKLPVGSTNLPYWLASWFHKYYTHRCFTKANEKGILINPYTVNSDQYILNCFKRKVYGVITDVADRAYQIKQELC